STPDYDQFDERSNDELATEPIFTKELYDYQKEGLKWLKHRTINCIGGLLGDDMGLGKTAQIIALVSWIIERALFEHILIIVPSTLLENWKREFEFFAPRLTPYVHHGTNRTGSIEFLKRHPIVITSYSMAINDQYLLNKLQWGATILDEASLIKNPKSERRIAVSALPSTVRIAMTGTPVENSLLDLWSIGDYVFPGYFGTSTEFSDEYIDSTLERTITSSDLNALKDSLSKIMLRRKKEDVLESLPDRIDIHQALIMNRNEADGYESRRLDILRDQSAKAGVQLALIQQMRQYCTHPFLLEESAMTTDITKLQFASTKFKRTIEILNEIQVNKEKVLIFTEYLDMIDAFQASLTEHFRVKTWTIDGRIETTARQTAIDEFSKEEGFAMLILNPKTAGMGLNITAANHVIHYTRQWNPALEEQASARAYRNGQKKGVNVYYLYYVDTIEEIIDHRLRLKRTLSGEVVSETDTELSMEDYLRALSYSPINH
ncbi:MAG: DEAD/DEAH box helicase, partial [Sphingobacteriales bacterium]